ncbi:RRS1-domain-containing protein [Gonapodya prolifera JEL478]|uniref:Ribosome biogenesis regulatory protein n=1 Tax=Gonapodya prolifera (strain JEL478) TaxID=1344416 RepID=A0A139A2B7_GONPJ|nr:RRS1-domain-containing protein [Gonapodya prolifera JEL478]|eukprot:KXS10891.1 RRS1-domain-containing protein [Gonapodya prolifera JEL478]
MDVDTADAPVSAPFDVQASLDAHRAKYEPLQVTRPIPIALDLGNLLADDPNPLDVPPSSSSLESSLRSNARDCVQFLVNHLFALPTTTAENHVVVNLPAPTTHLPREKPVPKAKPMTRWERFAKTKGIVKQKKSKMVFDEMAGEYRPAYGYKSRNNLVENDWLKEVPASADPMADMFQAERDEKKERIEKNLKRKRRNEEEAAGVARNRAVGVGAPLAHRAVGSAEKAERKAQLDVALAATRKSTASMGNFDKKIAAEKTLKTKGVRKLANLPQSVSDEKSRALKLISKIGTGEPVVNMRKAVGQALGGKKRTAGGDRERPTKRQRKGK